MLIPPGAWFIPPSRRYFPRELVERYEDENTPLVEVVDMWEWKHDLAPVGPIGPVTDSARVEAQLAREAREFMEEVERQRESEQA